MLAKIKLILFMSATLSAINPTQGQEMAKKTQNVKVEIRINAPAEKVWEAMVLDYGNIANFSPYIYSSDYQNGSLKGEKGAERTCSFNAKGTRWVHEKIKDIDHENMTMYNLPIGGAKLPMDFDNSMAIYQVKDNGDGTSTASYDFHFRMKPAFMGALARGSFKKQLAGTLVGLKHFVETGEKVTPSNGRYKVIKDDYRPIFAKS